MAVLSIPFIVVTLGLFYFLINVLMLYVTDWVAPTSRSAPSGGACRRPLAAA